MPAGSSSRVFCARFSSICSVSPEMLSVRMIWGRRTRQVSKSRTMRPAFVDSHGTQETTKKGGQGQEWTNSLREANAPGVALPRRLLARARAKETKGERRCAKRRTVFNNQGQGEGGACTATPLSSPLLR